MAELTNLLKFMSTRDRQAALKKYNAIFDAAGDEQGVIAELGSPTKLAISIARSYVPSAEEDILGPTADGEDPAAAAPADGTVPEAAPVPEAELQPPCGTEPDGGADSPCPAPEKIDPIALVFGMDAQAADDAAQVRDAQSDAPQATPEPEESGPVFTSDTAMEDTLRGAPADAAQVRDAQSDAPQAAPEPEESGPVFTSDAAMEDTLRGAPADAAQAQNAQSDALQAAPEPEESGPVFTSDTAMEDTLRGALADAAQVQNVPQWEPPLDLQPELPLVLQPEPEESDPVRGRARPAALVIYSIFALILGLPVALVLLLIGIPFLLLGGGLIAGIVYGALTVLPLLGMVSDVLLVAGSGLVLTAAGLVIAWFGLWVSISLGSAWIGGVVFRLGRRLCFRKEVPGQ